MKPDVEGKKKKAPLKQPVTEIFFLFQDIQNSTEPGPLFPVAHTEI